MADSISVVNSTKLKSEIIYFEKMDVIRFFAAFMVVIYHAYQGWKNQWGIPEIMLQADQKDFSTTGQLLHNFFMNGDYGVELFFIISGFLITYILLKEKESNDGRIDFLKFYARRGLRILPLYYLIILLSPLLVNWVGQNHSPSYVANIFFYGNFNSIQNHDNWIFPLAHFWSLCIEEHFYLFWPFILAFVPNKHLNKIFVAMILLSAVYRGYVFLNHDNAWFHLYLSTFSRFDALVIGALTAYAHFTKPIQFNINRIARTLVYLVLLLSICSFNIMSWDSFLSACFKKYFYIALTLFIMLDFLFNDVAFLKFMNNKLFRYFGKISFGIYVYGLLVFEIIIQKIMGPFGINNIYFYWFLVIFLSIIIPVISYELFEKRILKLKKHFRVIRIKEEN